MKNWQIVCWWLAALSLVFTTSLRAQDEAKPPQEEAQPEAVEQKPATEKPAEEAPAESDPAKTETEGETQPPAASDATDRKPSESFLPNSTRAWVSIPNPRHLNEAFAATQIGQLVHDETLKPFVEDVSNQIRNWLDEDALRHGIRLSKLEEMDTGEICIAGILPEDAVGAVKPENHAIALLVDVEKCIDQAEKLLAETAGELREAGATSTVETINEIETTKWTFPEPEPGRRQRFAYQAIVGQWLVACNNREVFTQIIRWISRPDLPVEETLASDQRFVDLIKRAEIEAANGNGHIRWYVDPFGYMDLARVIAEEDQDPITKQRSNNYVRIIKNSGFDAIKGLAGSLSFNTEDHQMVHRTFVYAPPVEGAGELVYEKSAVVLDFFNRDGLELDPEDWVTDGAASYISFVWNLEKLVNHIHHVVDAVTDTGSYERMLNNIKESNGVDVRKLVGCLSNRITVVTEVTKPIGIDSEKLVLAIGIKRDEANVREQVRSYFGGALKVDKAGDVEIYSEEIFVEEEDPLFKGLEGLDDEAEDEVAADEEEQLIERKYVTVHQGRVLICNDLDHLKKLVTTDPESSLKDADDYARIRKTLDELVDPAKVSLRQFSRLDRVFEANYQLIRNNDLKTANTLFAKMMASARREAELKGREPKQIDTANMPEYETAIAPFLGPTGWVIESEADGWRITSCVLNKPTPTDPVTTTETTKVDQ